MFQVVINVTANKWVPKIAENTLSLGFISVGDRSQIIVSRVVQNDFPVFMLPTQHII